jgi:hypothetical protein
MRTWAWTMLALAGCGGADTGAVDNVINSVAEQQCAWEFRCCTDPEIMKRDGTKYTDQMGCLSFAKLALENTLYAERLAAKQGRIKVDGEKSNACIDKLKMKACNTPPGQPPPDPPAPGYVDPCSLIFVGNTAVGEACLISNECVKGSHCYPVGSGEGVCVPYQQEMQICNQSSDCDPSVTNLYCARKDWKCHLRSPVGGPCAYTVDMVTMMPTLPVLLECDNTSGDVFCDPGTNTCRKLPVAGESCVSPRPPGVGSGCDQGLQCDTSVGMPGVCRGPGAAGDPCSGQFPCKPDGTLYCDQLAMPPTCKMLPGVGDACLNGQCARPAYCNNMVVPAVCAKPAALGEACSGQIRCDTTLYCDTQAMMPTCKNKLADGTSCMSNAMCISGLCAGTCLPQNGAQCIGRM